MISTLGSEKDAPVQTKPNQAHRALALTLLHYIHTKVPLMRPVIDGLLSARWNIVSYPLQRSIPFTPKLNQRFGIVLTWGEALIALPLFILQLSGIYTSFINSSVSLSDQVSRLPLALCFITASHNSVLGFVLGIPFDRALRYHKTCGYIAFLNGLMHTACVFLESKHSNDFFADNPNASGTCLLLMIAAATITSMPVVRQKAFEIFYYSHLLFVASMVICAFYHSGLAIVLIAAIVWFGDLFIRKIFMARYLYPNRAVIHKVTDDMVEISFPKIKEFTYNPGQYVYLSIPELSIFEWHPFSISTSPFEEVVKLLIKRSGNWTSSICNSANSKSKISILLEGTKPKQYRVYLLPSFILLWHSPHTTAGSFHVLFRTLW